MNEKTKGPQLVPVTLAKGHKHAGVDRSAGDVIHVSTHERDWLVKHGIVNAPAALKEGAK